MLPAILPQRDLAGKVDNAVSGGFSAPASQILSAEPTEVDNGAGGGVLDIR
jgi:hypothetical protein